MRETSELQAATLQEMKRSDNKVEEEEKAEFFNFAMSCRHQDTINLLNSWENWYENGPAHVSTTFKEKRKQLMPKALFLEFTKKTRKREVVKRGPERCDKGHNLKRMKRQQLLCPNEEDENQMMPHSSKECSYKNCEFQD